MVTLPGSVRDFASAKAYLAEGRNKDDRPIENNTRVHRLSDDRIAIRLHGTDVVIYESDGTVELNTGHWYTVTTKDRINRYIGSDKISIGSDRGRWFVYRAEEGELVHFDNHPEWDYRSTDHVKLCRFFDGMRVKDDEVLNPPPERDTERLLIDEDNTSKRIDRFVDGYMRALDAGMDTPGAGDCWFCSMVVTSENAKGKTLGDAQGDLDHLLSHLKERYYVPSMLLNAVKERGYGDPNFVMAIRLDQAALAQGQMKIRRAYGGTSQPDRGSHKEFRRDLRRYLRRRLLPNIAGHGPTIPGQPTSGYAR